MPGDGKKESVSSHYKSSYPMTRTLFSGIASGFSVAAATYPAEFFKKLFQGGEGKSVTQEFLEQKQLERKMKYPGVGDFRSSFRMMYDTGWGKSPTVLDNHSKEVTFSKLWHDTKTKYPNISNFGLIWKIIRDGEFGGHKIYRGFGIFAINIIPTTTLQVSTNALFPTEPGSQKEMGIALLSGFVGAFPATIVENCVRWQQVRKNSLPQATREIVSESYLRPLRSFPLVAIRDMIFTFYLFSFATSIEKWAEDRWGFQKYSAAWYGVSSLACALGAAISHPFDTIATRMQNPDRMKMPFKQALDLANIEVLTVLGGTRGYFKGLPFRIFLFIAFIHIIRPFKENYSELFNVVVGDQEWQDSYLQKKISKPTFFVKKYKAIELPTVANDRQDTDSKPDSSNNPKR